MLSLQVATFRREYTLFNCLKYYFIIERLNWLLTVHDLISGRSIFHAHLCTVLNDKCAPVEMSSCTSDYHYTVNVEFVLS
jgi:hypothetical protein